MEELQKDKKESKGPFSKYIELMRQMFEPNIKVSGTYLSRATLFATVVMVITFGIVVISKALNGTLVVLDALMFGGFSLSVIALYVVSDIRRVRSSSQTPTSKTLTVIEAMNKRKANKSNVVASLCIMSGSLMLLFNILPNFSGIFIGLIVVGVLVVLDSLLFAFRVERGYYGTNDWEAREILNFILKEASKDDLDGMSGGLRPKVMTDADLDEIKQQVQGLIPQAGL